jgi:hypothetical protein
MKRKIATWMIIGVIGLAVLGCTQAANTGPSPAPTSDSSVATPPPASPSIAPPQGGVTFEPIPDDNPLKIPWLTEDQKAKAIEIAMSDARVQELIKDRPYEMGEEVGLVHEGEVQLGATVTIKFNEIYEIVYDWPYAYPTGSHNGQPTYFTGTIHATREVTRLVIWVNLADEVVLSIQPLDIDRWKFE